MPHLWADRRCGAGGKSERVRRIVEHHWDSVERDFAHYYHFDALDWIRGLRSWDQFLRYVDYLCETQGSKLWAAKLNDPELIDQLEAEMKRDGQTSLADIRPPLVGFDQHASALLLLTNQVVATRMESGNPKAKMLKGPVFPMEIVEERLSRHAAAKRSSAIARAMENYTRKHSKVNQDA